MNKIIVEDGVAESSRDTAMKTWVLCRTTLSKRIDRRDFTGGNDAESDTETGGRCSTHFLHALARCTARGWAATVCEHSDTIRIDSLLKVKTRECLWSPVLLVPSHGPVGE